MGVLSGPSDDGIRMPVPPKPNHQRTKNHCAAHDTDDDHRGPVTVTAGHPDTAGERDRPHHVRTPVNDPPSTQRQASYRRMVAFIADGAEAAGAGVGTCIDVGAAVPGTGRVETGVPAGPAGEVVVAVVARAVACACCDAGPASTKVNATEAAPASPVAPTANTRTLRRKWSRRAMRWSLVITGVNHCFGRNRRHLNAFTGKTGMEWAASEIALRSTG